MDFARITRNLEEVLTEEELRQELASDRDHTHYIGFEISGKIHLGTGIVAMGKVKDLMDAGVVTMIFLADWHTFINEKLGGANFTTIQNVAKRYFTEGLKAAFKCVGGDEGKIKIIEPDLSKRQSLLEQRDSQAVNVILGKDFYNEQGNDYWENVIRISREVTLARAKRSVDIMGRVANEEMPTATLFYPMMQVADIFMLGVSIAHGGLDQRKAHVIARDVALKLEKTKPIALHHHLVLGLGKPPVWPIPAGEKREAKIAMKMSKSKPDSAVFIHDSPDEIKWKIKKSFCPPKEVIYNPMLDWVKHVLFLGGEGELMIKRSLRHGGALTLSSAELSKHYAAGEIHPEDLKNAVAERLIEMLEPARSHFASGAPKEMLEDLERLMEKA